VAQKKKLECKNMVYEPAEDTFLLYRAVLAEARPTDSVLEIGCGKGLICCNIASKVRTVLATDMNPHAVWITRESGVPTIRTDLFRGIKAKFDMVLFNPPYLPTSEEEKIDGWLNYALDGGPSGRETIERFFEDLRSHLSPQGRALLLVSSLAGLMEIEALAIADEWDFAWVASERHFFEELRVLKLF
jgi:release factor glutamine methyltransferase